MRKRDEIADPRSCLNKAGDDEWLFVLLDRDEAMASTIRHWIGKRIELKLNQVGDEKMIEAEKLARVVDREWPTQDHVAQLGPPPGPPDPPRPGRQIECA